jgi:hypothetical protein
VYSQKETYRWFFGHKVGLDFNQSPPSAVSNGAMNANEGCASMADANGNLLFYTNGVTVWNQTHAIMQNGTGLFANISSSQGVLAVRQPGSQNLYYVFTIDYGANGLRYSIIDMTLAAGMGSVTVKNAPLYVAAQHTEKLCGVRHCNGIDIWIMTHEMNTSNFRAYLLTAGGISTTPVISSVGSIHTAQQGYLKFSPSGKKLAAAIFGNSISINTELFDFDNTTGIVSNSLSLPADKAYGVEFSPDGSKLYISRLSLGIVQWNLCAGSNQAIIASQFTVFPASIGIISEAALQTGPDGKIYVAGTPTGSLFGVGVINNPNSVGANCNYFPAAVPVYSMVFAGLPNFVCSSIKAPFTFAQDLGCLTVTFTPPSIAIPSLAACPSVANVPVSVSWLFGDAGSGSNNASALLTPVHVYPSLGSYNVRMVINYSNCAPDTVYQTISLVSPTITVSSSSVSCSAFATATVNVLGGSGSYNYTWTPSGQSASVAVNLSGGIYTVVAGNQGGVCTSSYTTTIVNPVQVTATLSNTISCSTASAAATVTNGSGGYTYQWLPSLFTTSLVTALAPGNHTLIITDTINHCSFTKTLQVTTLATPVLTVSGNFTICPGQSASLTVAGADTYTWSTGLNTSTIVLTSTVATNFSVSGTYTGSGCSVTRVFAVIPSKCLGIQLSENTPGLKLYPNPTSGILQIESGKSVLITLADGLGRIALSGRIKAGKTALDITHLANGIYFMKVEDGSSSKIFKVQKQGE